MFDSIQLARGLTLSHTGDVDGAIVVGVNDKYYQLGGMARDLVLALEEGALCEEDLFAKIASNEDLAPAARQKTLFELSRRGIIDRSGDAGAPQPSPSPLVSRSYMSLRWGLFSAAQVDHMCRLLLPLFASRVLTALLPLAFCFNLLCFWRYGAHATLAIPHLTGVALVSVIVLNYAALLLHELGHAAAARRGGQRPGSIGVGLYVFFPVMFIDVGKAWLLPRDKRIAVDVGGIYLSLLSAGFAWLVYIFDHAEAAAVVAFLISLTLISNLNPFIRMDGYWFLSDALGIPNLMSLNREMATGLLSWRPGRALPRLPQIPGAGIWVKRIYLCYFAGFLLFACYLIWLTIFQIVPGSVAAASAYINDCAAYHRYGGSLSTLIGHGIGTLIFLVPTLAVFVMGGSNLIRRLRDANNLRQSDNSGLVSLGLS